MAFHHRFTARFHQVDSAGVVFFGRFFEIAHDAFEAFLDEAFGADSPMDGGGWAMPLVHAEADFRRPVRRGDRLLVETRVLRASTRSVTFAHRIRGADDPADERAVVQLKHAFVALPAFHSIDRPPVFAEACQRLGLLEQASEG
jgi:acyl-CoA thioesterase FadM